MDKAVSVVSPIVELALEDLRQLLRDHELADYRLVPTMGFLLKQPVSVALDDNPPALVGALLQLSIECLTIHLLAEAMPHHPVADILDEAIQQLRRS